MPDARTDEIAAARDVAWTAQAFVQGTATRGELELALRVWHSRRSKLSKQAFRRTGRAGAPASSGDTVSQDASLVKQDPGHTETLILTPEETRDLAAGKKPRRLMDRVAAQEENGKKVRNTWLSPYGEAWKEQYGGEPVWGQLARSLKPVHDSLGAEEALRRWRAYLVDTPARFASPTRFASIVGEYAVGAVRGPRTASDPLPGENVDAYIARVGRSNAR